jgi:nucleoside-diphosphate-sugar epimerase
MTFWSGRRVLVTGGASFIGSHLTERLVDLGAEVRVADDLSSGSPFNLTAVADGIEFVETDLRDVTAAGAAVADREIVFHLAADHGGRGYIEQHQVACASNFALDQTVFAAALAQGCDQITFASSACVYPIGLQADVDQTIALREDHVGPPYDPDGLYGMAKLSAELTLEAMGSEHGLSTASCRYFTVYGPRNPESHGLAAMIARAFVGEDPFEIWGTGHQRRNWTHVDDIVRGTIAAAEQLTEGAVNLGATTTHSVLEAATLVLELTGHEATITPRPDQPTGPLNRAADGTRAKRLLGFEPEMPFESGLASTIEWYGATHDRERLRRDLQHRLLEREEANGPTPGL